MTPNHTGILKRHGWTLVLPVLFLVYATSFNGFEILEKRHSVLAEADSAAFNILIANFDPATKYGNEYKLGERQLGDVAQKHKIHHTLYFLIGGTLGTGLSSLYERIGVSPTHALYTVNALLSCVNIVLLYLLLKTLSSTGRHHVAMIVLYGFSLSTWLYSSVAESWILSVTVLLLFLLAFWNSRNGLFALSAIVGIAMTNNIWLCTLYVFLLLRLAAQSARAGDFAKRALAGGATAILTWALAMSVFSFYDRSLSPLNYIRYTLWFKQHIAPPIIIFNSYFWKVSVTNIFVTSVLSNQMDPVVPQEALLYTIRQSGFGVVATCAYAAVLLATSWQSAVHLALKFREADARRKVLADPTFQIAVFVALWVVMPVILDASGAFLFSTLVTPLVIATHHRHYRGQERIFGWLLHGTVFLVVANNVMQVMIFRDALERLH